MYIKLKLDKPATLLIPVDFSSPFAVEELYGTR
jgi:hypothetical protein